MKFLKYSTVIYNIATIPCKFKNICFYFTIRETRDILRVWTLKDKYLTIGIVNVVDSQISREMIVEFILIGKEYGVASAKSFTSTLCVLSLLSLDIKIFFESHDELYIKKLIIKINRSNVKKILQDNELKIK